MPSNMVLDLGPTLFDHPPYYRSLTPPIVDFTNIPLCFAPPYTIPFLSKSAETLPCMDHPDLPAGMRMPRKKKDNLPCKNDRNERDSRYPPSIKSNGFGEKRPQSPALSDGRNSNAQTFSTHPAIAPLDSGLPTTYNRHNPWESYNQPPKDTVPQRRFTLLSRRSKPWSTRTSLDKAPVAQPPHQSQAQHQSLTQLESKVVHGKSFPPPAAYGSTIAVAVSTNDDVAQKSRSPPSTPGFMRRLKDRIENAPRPRTPSPTFPYQGLPQSRGTNHPETGDLALFAAATAGLSPEQPFVPGQIRQQVPLSQPKHRYSTSKSYTSQVPLPLSPSRKLSTSSSSHRTPSIVTSSFDRESAGSSVGHQSRPSLPRMSSDSGPRGSHVLPYSNPLSRRGTQSSRGSSASRDGLPRRSSASRSLDVPRQSEPEIPDIPLPNPLGSPQMRDHSPAPRSQTPSHLQVQTQLNSKPLPPPPTIAAPVPSPISPPDTAIPWLHENVSALSVDATAYRHNPRISAISTLSGISGLDGGVSPIDPEDDFDDLPDYRSSQEEMARMRQLENARRAQELQRRWMESRGN